MPQRIDNNGGSYGDYTKPKYTEFDIQAGVLADEYFITRNAKENGQAGIPIGEGQYIHQGSAPEAPASQVLPKDIPTNSNFHGFLHGRAKSETEYAASAGDDYDFVTAVAAQPHFDFYTNRASVQVVLSNGKTQTISGSNQDVLNWVQGQIAEHKLK